MKIVNLEYFNVINLLNKINSVYIHFKDLIVDLTFLPVQLHTASFRTIMKISFTKINIKASGALFKLKVSHL